MWLFSESLPKVDLPVDFLAGEDFFENILRYYSKYPCKIKSFIFVLCKEGKLYATINHERYEINTGDFVILLPDTLVQAHTIEGSVKLAFIGFSSNFLEENMVKLNYTDSLPLFREKAVLSLSKENYDFYNNLFQLLIQGNETQGLPSSGKILKQLLEIILEQLSELYKKQFHPELSKLNRENEIFLEFMKLLYENYQIEHSVSFYAGKVGVTQQHFCKTIKQVSGKTPSEIVNRLLITDAKSNLKSSSLPIKQIAFSLGFKNLSFFFRFFKKHTGLTPHEYREKE